MSRPGLHEWLRSCLDKQSILGLVWDDKALATFRVPWRNQKSKSLYKEDTAIFEEYAKFTGKYNSSNKKDVPKWKQNLKSAMNKNPSLRRRQDRDRAGVVKPYRVYQFVPEEVEKRRKAKRKENQSNSNTPSPRINSESGQTSSSTSSTNSGASCNWFLNDAYGRQEVIPPTGTIPAFRSLLDSAVDDDDHFVSTTLYQNSPQMLELQGPPAFDLALRIGFDALSLSPTRSAHPDTEGSQVAEPMQPSSTLPQQSGSLVQLPEELQHVLNISSSAASDSTTMTPQSVIASDLEQNFLAVAEAEIPVYQTQDQQESSPMSFDETANGSVVQSTTDIGHMIPTSLEDFSKDHDLLDIQVIYGSPGSLVKNHRLRASSRCRLYFHSPSLMNHVHDELRGSGSTEQVQLPSVDEVQSSSSLEPNQKKHIQKTLDEFQRGIFISCNDGHIYAERRCKSRIFFSNGVDSSLVLNRPSKENPNVLTKIYDIQDFITSVDNHYRNPTVAIGKDHVLLTIGQEIEKNDDYPRRKLLFYIVIRHIYAAYIRMAYEPVEKGDGPQVSKTDSFDAVLTDTLFQC